MNNNYTTTEQSDRLINAGVPASSADCYFYTKVDKQPKILTTDKFDWLESPYVPCWSVGRLIEIYELCTGNYWEHNPSAEQNSLIDSLIDDIYFEVGNFSKLED